MANKQHPLMQGDRLAKELAAQQARVAARLYVTDKGTKTLPCFLFHPPSLPQPEALLCITVLFVL